MCWDQFFYIFTSLRLEIFKRPTYQCTWFAARLNQSLLNVYVLNPTSFVTHPSLHFLWIKIIQHGPKMIAIDCIGLFLPISKEKWPNYCLWTKNPHPTVTRFGCVGFSMYGRVFMRQFCSFTHPRRSKWVPSEKTIFFFQNRHLL